MKGKLFLTVKQLVIMIPVIILIIGCDVDDDSGNTMNPLLLNNMIKAVVTYDPDKLPVVNGNILVDGSASSSVTEEELTYSWEVTEKPALSALTLDSIKTSKFNFNPDIAGTYILKLTVSDGTFQGASSVLIDVWHKSEKEIKEDCPILKLTWNGTVYKATFSHSAEWNNIIQDDTIKYCSFYIVMLSTKGDFLSDSYYWVNDVAYVPPGGGIRVTASGNNDDLPDQIDLGAYTLEQLRENFSYIDANMIYREKEDSHYRVLSICSGGNGPLTRIQIVVDD